MIFEITEIFKNLQSSQINRKKYKMVCHFDKNLKNSIGGALRPISHRQYLFGNSSPFCSFVENKY